MRGIGRAQLASRYIFFEMLPGFFIGVFVFICILLMFQALRLTEFVLVHGVPLQVIGQIVLYLSISFLPAILPMSLLFSVLLTYGRLSQDSEIVALKASGLSMAHLTLPALALGVLVSLASAETSFNVGPWGNRQFEVLVTEVGNSKIADTIRSGTFSDGFYDLVVYAHNVNSRENLLEKVFIYDGRDEQLPVTIIAQQGRLIHTAEKKLTSSGLPSAQSSSLSLENGSIHRANGETYTKVNFKKYVINLAMPTVTSFREKSPQSLTYQEIDEMLTNQKIETEKRLILTTEFHKRWALSFACVIFGYLGVSLGTVTNRRSARSSGLMISLLVIILYWGFYVTGETMARKGTVTPWAAVWTPNLISAVVATYFIRKSW